ncbi:MAG: hypothetical protein QM755_08655 [Luteolibacter sp.]
MIRPVLYFCLLAAPAMASTWYVSPGGDDRAIGSETVPIGSLSEALNRAAKRADGDSEIVLMPGQHALAKTLEINDSHASPAKGLLTLRGRPGAVVSGFKAVPVQGWKKPDAATLKQLRPDVAQQVVQVLYSQIGSGDPGHLSRRGFNVAEVRETPPALLFIGGNAMPLSAWPDQGTVKPGAIVDAGPTRDGADSRFFYKRGGTFRFSSDRLAAWTKERNLWVDGTFGYDWEWSFNQISRINRLTQTITLADGEVSGLMNESFLHPGFRVVNAISEISVPGEYLHRLSKETNPALASLCRRFVEGIGLRDMDRRSAAAGEVRDGFPPGWIGAGRSA